METIEITWFDYAFLAGAVIWAIWEMRKGARTRTDKKQN